MQCSSPPLLHSLRNPALGSGHAYPLLSSASLCPLQSPRLSRPPATMTKSRSPSSSPRGRRSPPNSTCTVRSSGSHHHSPPRFPYGGGSLAPPHRRRASLAPPHCRSVGEFRRALIAEFLLWKLGISQRRGLVVFGSGDRFSSESIGISRRRRVWIGISHRRRAQTRRRTSHRCSMRFVRVYFTRFGSREGGRGFPQSNRQLLDLRCRHHGSSYAFNPNSFIIGKMEEKAARDEERWDSVMESLDLLFAKLDAVD